MRVLGLHLLQSLDLVDSPRPSAIVELDATGALVSLTLAGTDDEIVEALGREPALVTVDAPVHVPNRTGRRDIELLLAWCDVPAFPVSRDRHLQVFGGLRAAGLASRLPAGMSLVETLPDLALRMLMWEEETGGADLDLGDYRGRWLGVRPPVYRPKGSGRATPAGLLAAWGLLARHVDLAGWAPEAPGDDWTAIRDAAVLDAVACAHVGVRATGTPPAATVIGTRERGDMLIPVDGNLRRRIQLNLERLRADGAIGI